MVFRNVKFAWQSLIEGKIKSLFSISSIAISVVTLISILSISQGFSKYVVQQFSLLGTNMMWVESDESNGQSDIGMQTSINIGNLAFVDSFSPQYVKYDKVYEDNGIGSVAVCGVNSCYAAITNLTISGQFISERDCSNHNAVCVISDDVRKKYFYHDQNPIGKQIKISNMYYTIIGYVNPSELDSTGLASSTEQENAIYIPYTSFQNNYSSTPLNRVVFTVQDTNKIKEYSNQIDGLMSVGISKGCTYTIHSISHQMNNALDFVSKINVIFVVFIIITLLISGIGIMNVMLMSTMEKKWKIGLLKSIGARSMDVLLQFIIEILILSVIGAAFGVFGGVIVISIVSSYENAITVSLNAVGLSILFCFALSFVFGLIPAIKASKLLPLECLEKN